MGDWFFWEQKQAFWGTRGPFFVKKKVTIWIFRPEGPPPPGSVRHCMAPCFLRGCLHAEGLRQASRASNHHQTRPMSPRHSHVEPHIRNPNTIVAGAATVSRRILQTPTRIRQPNRVCAGKCSFRASIDRIHPTVQNFFLSEQKKTEVYTRFHMFAL